MAIERQIVEFFATENDISISKDLIDEQIKEQRVLQGLSKKAFQAQLKKELKISYEEWRSDLRYKLLRRRVIQLNLRITAPTTREVQSFYNQNKEQIGMEFLYREIVVIPRNNSIEEEKRISAIASSIHGQLQKNPEDFAKIARSHPHNSSSYKKRGGLRPYQSIYELAAYNPVLTSLLYSHPLNRVSYPFRDSLKRYVIVKNRKQAPAPSS